MKIEPTNTLYVQLEGTKRAAATRPGGPHRARRAERGRCTLTAESEARSHYTDYAGIDTFLVLTRFYFVMRFFVTAR